MAAPANSADYVAQRRPEPGHGEIGEGLSLGITDLLTQREPEDTTDYLILRTKRVGGVPFLCAGLIWAKGAYRFPRQVPMESQGARFMGTMQKSRRPTAVYLHETPWPGIAHNFTRDSRYVWSPIPEIVNNRHVYGLLISSDCTRFFEAHRRACFIFKDDGAPLPSPSVVYNGAYRNEIASAIGLGKTRASPFSSLGPYYYFGSFRYSLIFATSAVDGDSRKVGNLTITRKNPKGVYKIGGMARYAVLEGAVTMDPKPGWVDSFDTLVTPRLKGHAARYIATNFSQQIPLDYADVDTSRMRNKRDLEGARVVATFDDAR